jgi:aminoglycoside 3-N-acetyltransferase
MNAVSAILASGFVKRWVKLALPILPAPLRRKVFELAGAQRRAQARQRKQRTQFSVQEIAAALDRCSFSGDLILHSSISNIGKLKDGTALDLARQVLSRLDLKVVTLLAPALPFNTSMQDYLDQCSGFDVRTAKNAMGAIANIVMQQEGCLRSLHPSHSTLALGANAAQYINGHENDSTPFGPHSPYAKLTRNRGQILMFGVGLNSVTNFHVYEDLLGALLPFEVYQPRRYRIPCIDRHGRTVVVESTCHSPSLAARRDCERARAYLERGGHIRTQRIGESEISLLDARGLTTTLLEMLLSGDSIYGTVSLSGAQARGVRKCLAELP